MKKKALAAAMLSLALTPCMCLLACNATDKPEKKPIGSGTTSTAETKLENQVTGTKDTYTGIYSRAERNGGLFSTSSQKSASVARYVFADDAVTDEPAATPDETQIEIPDTNELISQLLTAIKSGGYSLPANNYALESYVLDVFAYTQIASSIVSAEGKHALTKNYSVDYDYDSDLINNMKTSGNWYPNIPEEMSFAGFDEETSKVNLVFKARNPNDKRSNINKFETVNSEMYYISDNDFGYAQFTYRENETGFNYFSMKDKAMLEINFNKAGNITYLNTYDGTTLNNISAANKQTVETCLAGLELIFAARTIALEQQNLALAKEAGIEGIKTETVEGETVYVKGNAEKPYKVTFDYSVLAKMKG